VARAGDCDRNVQDLLDEFPNLRTANPPRNHLRQMMEKVRALVWPSMGNAQRFSQP
jgi:hypothetical protein